MRYVLVAFLVGIVLGLVAGAVTDHARGPITTAQHGLVAPAP